LSACSLLLAIRVPNAFEVESEEALEDVGVGEVGKGVGEPGRALVVEVGEGALREIGRVEAGRVEPAVAELDESAGGLPYSLALLGGAVRAHEGRRRRGVPRAPGPGRDPGR